MLLFEAERDGAGKDGVAKNIYRDVLVDLIPAFILDTGTPSPKKARHHYYMEGPTKPEQSRTTSIDANDIANLLDYCRTMQLTDEKRAIMDELVKSSKTVDPSGFGTLFIPLFVRLVELSRANNISLDENISKSCVQDVLTIYVQRYIGPEPAKPRDWAQACTGCRCGDCESLSRFMANPSEKVGRFAMAEKRRRHLENRLRGTRCSLDTERRGSPHTLVVTKTLRKWHESLQGWKGRCEVATESFRTVGTQAMEQIFGEHYEDFTSFKAVKLGPAARVSAEPEVVSTSSSKPRPLKTASGAQPAPPLSVRAPNVVQPRENIARQSMATLSRAISRNVNAHEVARIEGKRQMKEASLKSDENSKTPHLNLPLEQRPVATSTTEYIDLTSE